MTSFLRSATRSLLLLLLTATAARAQAWQTAIGLGNVGGSYSHVKSTTTDAAGNVYLAGYFSGTVQFGGINVASEGLSDLFVAKWSPAAGTFVWAERAGGPGEDSANSVAVKETVNGPEVVVAGTFGSGTAVFNATRNIQLVNMGSGPDIFVGKLTDAGASAGTRFAWVQQAGGTGSDDAAAIAVNGSEVYVAGSFGSATADFGGSRLTNRAGSPQDIFITKLVDSGTTGAFTWARRAGGASYDFATALAVSGTSVYVAGTFIGDNVDFGGTNFHTVGFSNDIFVTKLSDLGSSGSFVWTKQAGGPDNEIPYALAVQGNSVYVGGFFGSGSAAFDNLTLTNAVPGVSDAFVAKLTDTGISGAFTWAQGAGGSGPERVTALAVRDAGVYAAGSFQSSTATFGSTTLTNTGSLNTADVFVTKLTDAGSTSSFAWAQQAGGTSTEEIQGLALSGSALYVGGTLQSSPAQFAPLSIANAGGSSSGFLASLPVGSSTAASPATAWPGLLLYPNPARQQATVQLPAVAGAAQATLTLLDGLGRVVCAHSAPLPAQGTTVRLPLTRLAPGLYHLRVQAGGQHTMRALLVE